MEAILNSSSMADTIWTNLPLSGQANMWGDEIYFGTDISVAAEKNASDVVQKGELAYWPPGKACFPLRRWMLRHICSRCSQGCS